MAMQSRASKAAVIASGEPQKLCHSSLSAHRSRHARITASRLRPIRAQTRVKREVAEVHDQVDRDE
ncbi:hypothetical protein, partial [Roseateles sp.]|uniref:hypothetical protein n=1 Tax=Roseateles sp. TaxID=1971397 RepID=UPI00395C1168